MPHIMVKWFKGRNEQQKKEFAQALAKEAARLLERGEEHFSVSIEDYEPSEWDSKVYQPEIADRQDILYKKPGYGSLAEE